MEVCFVGGKAFWAVAWGLIAGQEWDTRWGVMATTKHKGLGRGLDELIKGGIGEAAEASASTKAPAKSAQKGTSKTAAKPATKAAAPVAAPKAPKTAAQGPTSLQSVQLIDLDAILNCPWQARRDFNEANLAELTASIREQGVLQPILLRVVDGQYELIAGERRVRAAQAAGLKAIPALVQEASDGEAMERSLIENIQRQNLNLIEEAEGYRTLIRERGYSQEEVAKKVGKARSSVTNSLRLLDLSDALKRAISEGKLSAGHAKVLLGVPDDRRDVLAARCVAQGLSVRALEKLVAAMAQKKPAAAAAKPDDASGKDTPADRQLKFLADRMEQELGTKVQLFGAKALPNGRREMGRIVIEFFDAEDLSRLLETLNLSDLA